MKLRELSKPVVGHNLRVHMSSKYMQCYLDEFTFRANHRAMRNATFDLLIAAV